MRIKPIKEPSRMTKAELLTEVARLSRGVMESDVQWCPVCADWYIDYDTGSGCEDHDTAEYGLSSELRYRFGLDKLGHKTWEGKPELWEDNKVSLP